MVSFTVEKKRSGVELYQLLEEVYPDFAKKALIAAFKSGIVTLNGKEAYGDDKVHAGDKIAVFVTGDVMGIDMSPRVVYQDENFVIVDKPAGLLSIGDTGEPNAVSMVEEFMKQRGEYSLDALMVPYLVYPLDKYVSGLLILAKHEHAYLFLIEALAQRRITRYFICPVRGRAEENDELMAYHIKDKASTHARILKKYSKDAKPIVTRYSALKFGETMSLLCVRPVTNYLHQVRAHLAYGGFPVLGDSDYGDRKFNKRNGAGHISLWLKTVVFEVGKRHEYEYMNGKEFESRELSFPKSVYDEGLMTRK
ncbi:MAG: RluA family pseudouridine synthase [Eubacteriales bacterium]|nr:RluA family pseudouridine synthase [Eubacteriales bacterium]